MSSVRPAKKIKTMAASVSADAAQKTIGTHSGGFQADVDGGAIGFA